MEGWGKEREKKYLACFLKLKEEKKYYDTHDAVPIGAKKVIKIAAQREGVG